MLTEDVECITSKNTTLSELLNQHKIALEKKIDQHQFELSKSEKSRQFDLAAVATNSNALKEQIKLYEQTLRTQISQKPNTCPFPFCNGEGNSNGTSKTHTVLKNCPNKDKNPTIESFIQLV